MTVTLRVMLDQLASPTDPNLALASRETAMALIQHAPRDCQVAALVTRDAPHEPVGRQVPRLAQVSTTALPRRQLAAAYRQGLAAPRRIGMLHSPTLMAPLVRHDRVHNHDQVVVTVWDVDAWEPGRTRSWQRAMLKRAQRYADAVVVPTHSFARRLEQITTLGGRIRVIAAAAPDGFAPPADASARRHRLRIPDGALGIDAAGGTAELTALLAAIARSGTEVAVVVLGAGVDEQDGIAEAADTAGIPLSRVHVHGWLEDADRAAVMSSFLGWCAPTRRPLYPWRVTEALALGVPVLASDSAVHQEVIAEGGTLIPSDAEEDAWTEAVRTIAEDATARRTLAVLSGDRGRGFSWRDAAMSIWQLHAEL